MAKRESKAINKKEKKEKKSKDKTSFFKSFKAELKKVSWPTPKQLVNNTTAVIVIVLILAAIVFVLDFAFEAANKYGIDKIKQSVISTEETTDEENVEGNSEGTEAIEETTTEEAQPTEVTVDAETNQENSAE